ncbi:hypothetical protein V8E51_014573 [Hyaloscypha variabilis]
MEDQVIPQTGAEWPPPVFQWWVFEIDPTNDIALLCEVNPVYEQDTNSVDPPPFPPSLSAFNANGASGCTYSGSSTSVGILTCPGVSDSYCKLWQEDEYKCGGGTYIWTLIFCEWHN